MEIAHIVFAVMAALVWLYVGYNLTVVSIDAMKDNFPQGVDKSFTWMVAAALLAPAGMLLVMTFMFFHVLIGSIARATTTGIKRYVLAVFGLCEAALFAESHTLTTILRRVIR